MVIAQEESRNKNLIDHPKFSLLSTDSVDRSYNGHFDFQDLGKGEGGKILNHIKILQIDQLELSNKQEQRACTLHNTHRSKCSHSNFNPKNELKYGLKHYFDIQHAIPNNYIFRIHTSSSGNQAVKAYKLSSSNL